MLKNAVDGLIDGLVEVLKIPILVGAQVLQFASGMGVEVPNAARPGVALLVSLFVVGLPIILDRLRSRTSKVIFAYGVLCTVVMLFLITSSTLFRQLASFRVEGHFVLKTIKDDPKSVTFPPIRYGNDSCDAREDHTNQVCSSSVEFANATATILSANCGSGVTRVSVDSANKKCIVAVSHLQGCGYDRLPFGINNCRGRGWIEFSVNGSGSSPEEHILGEGPLGGTVGIGRPLSFDLGTNHLGTNDKVQFEVSILNGDQVIARLTDAVPSQGEYSANVLPNGRLQISFGKLQAN